MEGLQEVKERLETIYNIQLYARTIDGMHILTQWARPYIEIRWIESSPGFWLDIREKETSKRALVYPGEKVPFERITAELKSFCEPAKPKQLKLF